MLQLATFVVSFFAAIETIAGIHFVPGHYEELLEPISPRHKKLGRVLPWLAKPKKRGFADRRLPVRIKTRPKVITLPVNYIPPKEIAALGKTFELEYLSPGRLASLEKEDLRMLLEAMSSIPIKVKIIDKRGHARSGKNRKHRFSISHWDYSNAAGAVILSVGVSRQQELFSEMIAMAPTAVASEFKGRNASLLNNKIMARTLVLMMGESDYNHPAQISKAAAFITNIYINYWARKNPRELKHYLFYLLKEAHNQMELTENPHSERNIGILLGSVIAGCIHHAQKIKATDERRIFLVNAWSNIIWAASSFLGIIPFSAEISALVQGLISVGVIVVAVGYEEYGPNRDFAPIFTEIQGYIEMAILDSAKDGSEEIKRRADTILHWMQASLHINGLSG